MSDFSYGDTMARIDEIDEPQREKARLLRVVRHEVTEAGVTGLNDPVEILQTWRLVGMAFGGRAPMPLTTVLDTAANETLRDACPGVFSSVTHDRGQWIVVVSSRSDDFVALGSLLTIFAAAGVEFIHVYSADYRSDDLGTSYVSDQRCWNVTRKHRP